jgi:BASS family bile acid:Na+ symporter
MLLLPLLCFGIAYGFELVPVLAVGLMLLSATPGGATANLYSHLAHGDVALNITLTAVNSILTLFTLPFIVNYAMLFFMGEGKFIPLQFSKVIQVFAIVLIPVGIGMLIKGRFPKVSLQLERPVKILSVLFLAAIVVSQVYMEFELLETYLPQIGLAALTFNVLSLTLGYAVPRLLGVHPRQAVAIGMEIGIHNGTLAIAIASSPLMLNNASMSIPAAIYSLIMFITAGFFTFIFNRHLHRRQAS